MASLKKWVKDGNYLSYEDKNLSSVTSATIGDSIDVSRLRTQTVYVEVTGNTGAVTVNIEHSPNQSSWYSLDSKTYTATNTNDSFVYDFGMSFIRTKTTTQSSSTVTTKIYGRN